MPDLADAEAADRLACADAFLKNNFNDDEERDAHGRWTIGDEVADTTASIRDRATEEAARRWKGIDEEELKAFRKGFDGIPDCTPAERHVYTMFYIMEGGKKLNGDTAAGITKETFKDMKTWGIPGMEGMHKPKELADDPKILILAYRAFCDRGLAHTGLEAGHLVLDDIGDGTTALIFMDGIFRDGFSGGAKMLHEALDNVKTMIPPEEASEIDQTYNNERHLNPKKLKDRAKDPYNYWVGRSSYRAISALVWHGYAKQLTMALACVRKNTYEREIAKVREDNEKNKTHKKPRYGPGDFSRLEYLLGPYGSLKDCDP